MGYPTKPRTHRRVVKTPREEPQEFGPDVTGSKFKCTAVALVDLGSYDSPMTEPNRQRYRLITGPDDAEFCRRVSEALDQGYQLHGPPALTFSDSMVIVGQALVLPPKYVTDAFPPEMRRMLGLQE